MENEIQTIKTLENQTQREKRNECSTDPLGASGKMT